MKYLFDIFVSEEHIDRRMTTTTTTTESFMYLWRDRYKPAVLHEPNGLYPTQSIIGMSFPYILFLF